MTTRKKIIHRARFVSAEGHVSALCSKRPRPIDIQKASWSLRDGVVTCGRCRKAIKEQPERDGATTAAETSSATGGTGQAIRIADANHVPVFNMKRDDPRAEWEAFASRIGGGSI